MFQTLLNMLFGDSQYSYSNRQDITSAAPDVNKESAKENEMLSTEEEGREQTLDEEILSLAFKIQPTVVMSCTGHSTYNAMRPYIEVTSETQKNEMEIWNRSEKQSALKNDITKILEGVDEATLIKVLELLKSA